jgi:hypothetical protein
MKKRIPFILIIVCGVLLCYSCKQTAETNSNLTPLGEVDTIDLQTYNSWVKGWEDKGKEYTDNTLTEYFTMPMVDLHEYALHPSAAARLVLGLDTTIIPWEPHIMLLSTSPNLQPILPPAANIYDLTTPCPRTCYPPRN